jgi:lipoate-protein ligase A
MRCDENLRADEELLRRGERAIRVAVLTDRSMSIGIGVPDQANCVRRARAENWRVVRRSSGGLALLHASGDLVWTVVLPRLDPRIRRDFVHAYATFGAPVVEFLRGEGLPATWAAAPALSDEYCLLGPRGQVLTSADWIVGGAAQHVTGTSVLHHGHLPRSLDRPALHAIFGAANPTGLDRLAGFEDLGVTGPSEELAVRLERRLRAHFVSGST